MVIERALQLELEDEDEGLSMTSLRQALPQDEEYRFRQAIQCTICLNSGHSAVDCNMQAPALFAILGHIQLTSASTIF